MDTNTLLNSNDILQYLISDGKLSKIEVATWEKEMKKEQVVKKHKRDIYFSNGRWCTYVDNKAFKNGRQQITASTEERIYEKLYNYYFNAITLEKLLDDWTRYSEIETKRSYKTITEDTNVFNRFLQDYSISKKDIRKLGVRDYIKYFDNVFRDFDPTKKQVNSIKTLIRQLYGQATMNGLSIINPVLQLDTYQNERDVKKNSRKGHRYLPIPALAQDILDKLPSDGEYILEKDGKPLLTNSFNRQLKKRCLECGIRYLSSHKIRFSNCTTLLENGVDIRDDQYAMGHTEQRMTEHYNRPNTYKVANSHISVVLTQGVQNVCT